MSSITFRGSNGSLTTAPRKLLNFGGSSKKQEAVAKKITSTIAKHTKLPDASATKKRVASTTPSKFPLYTLATTTTDADSSDVDALCSTLLQDSTHFEMLRYKDICARFKKSARTLLLPKPPRKLRYSAVFVSFAGTFVSFAGTLVHRRVHRVGRVVQHATWDRQHQRRRHPRVRRRNTPEHRTELAQERQRRRRVRHRVPVRAHVRRLLPNHPVQRRHARRGRRPWRLLRRWRSRRRHIDNLIVTFRGSNCVAGRRLFESGWPLKPFIAF